jgi:hypothetical protein
MDQKKINHLLSVVEFAKNFHKSNQGEDNPLNYGPQPIQKFIADVPWNDAKQYSDYLETVDRELQELSDELKVTYDKTQQDIITEDIIPMEHHLNETLNNILDNENNIIDDQHFIITFMGKSFVIDYNADSWDSMMELVKVEKGYHGLK